MSAQGQSTRSRIVEAARSLFWYDGYNVTTVDKILARAKANPGSFYRFFNTKESVLLTVLSNSARNFVPGLVTPVMQNVADPIERVFEILNFYRGNLTKAKFGCGCLLGKLASEISEEQPHIHQRIAIGFVTWTTAVAKCLEDAGQRFPAETDLKALSTFILAVMEGAVAQARAHQSIAPFDTAIQQLRKHFVLLQAVRRWEDEQNEFHLAQNARRRTRSRSKKNAPPSPDGTPENATSFQPGCAI
jgi:TetR/AcrR family transcriptional regulator, transcriptional repressor for nem operon